jgi:hypothetical protein
MQYIPSPIDRAPWLYLSLTSLFAPKNSLI